MAATGRRRAPSFPKDRDQIVDDVVCALNAVNLSMWAKLLIIKAACWAWNAFVGKVEGCPYWSVKAWDARCNRLKSGDQRVVAPKLIHEHVVPRKHISAHLLGMARPVTPEAVQEYLKTHAIACIVLDEEDRTLNKAWRSKMPPGFSMPGHELHGDVWARYVVKNIDRYEIDWGQDPPIITRRL